MIDKIVVATTTNTEDEAIEKQCQRLNIDCFRGSSEDVLDRYYHCAACYSDHQVIVRVTGDCPVIDPLVIDAVIEKFLVDKLDYASNILKETFPDGMDIEVFSRSSLEISHQEAKLVSEREHVTLYIRNQAKFKKGNVASPVDLSKFRLTIDRPEDFEVVKFVIENSDPNTSYQGYINLLLKHPEILEKNSKVIRNEGLLKSLKEDSQHYDI